METKVELIFKCETVLSDPDEISLKKYLERNIKGLVIESIKKEAKQFVVTSNLLSVAFSSEEQEAEVAKLNVLNKKLQVKINILKGELSATNKLKDQLTKNYAVFKEKNPEMNDLISKLKETLAECQKMSKSSAVAIEKNKELVKALDQVETERNTLVRDIYSLIKGIIDNKKTLNEFIESTKQSDCHNTIKEYVEWIAKLNENFNSMSSYSIIQAFFKQDSIKSKSSEIEELYNIDSYRKEKSTNDQNEPAVSVIRKELSEKCEEYAELEEAYNSLEAEYQLAENQIEALQASLEEKENLIASLRDNTFIESKEKHKTVKVIEEEPKKQIETVDTKGELSLEQQLAELKEQKAVLIKEQIELKAMLFDREQKLMDKGSDTEKKYKVLEEIKNLLQEILATYATMQTIIREVCMIYTEKVSKVTEYQELLTKYLEENNKKERLKRCELMTESLSFLNSIPKKITYIGMLDKCIIDTLKAKVGKGEEYKALVARYEKLTDLISKKFTEYEFKLSHY